MSRTSPEYYKGYTTGFKDGRREVNQELALALDRLASCFDDSGLGRDFDGTCVDQAREALAKVKHLTT